MTTQNRLLPAATLIMLLLFICSCHKSDKKILLKADREAPLGWIHLTIYADSSFVFNSKAIRSDVKYSGKIELLGDTIYFRYKDSIPLAGSIAIIRKGYVQYLNGTYPESPKITWNALAP